MTGRSARGTRHVLLVGIWLASALGGQAAEGGSIGIAWREPDGTIVLRLRAEMAGARGQGLLRYAPGHPAYRDVARHLGPIPPRGTVPVRPFPRNAPR